MDSLDILTKTKALFFESSGKLIVAKFNKIYLREEDGALSHLFDFPESWVNKLLGVFPLWFRMRRLGVMTGVLSETNYFFTYRKRIYSYSLKTKALVEEYVFSKGRGPLQFCKIKDIEGFSDSICFGEYFGNHQRDPVNIMQRKECGRWETVFQFGKGQINHVHALIPDIYNQCVWILAGDFEHSAAIYMAKNNFKNVELVVKGEQHYRACVAFPTKEGLLYATDTQIENNSIRILIKGEAKWKSKKLYDINGSCIYGCETKDYYIFSTSTEPNENPKSRIVGLLDNKPAKGIKLNTSQIVSYGKKDHSFRVVVSRPKDVFPYRIFQFGTIMFPSGVTPANLLFAYNVGSKVNDLSTECYSL